MKHTKVVLSLLLSSCASMVLAHSTATPYFNARSQSANLALEMVGQEGYINRFDVEDNYSVLSLAVGYQQTFRGSDIGCCIFGKDLVKCGDCSSINISGSTASGTRGERDWLADYFGLATDYKSSISFNPRISNVIVDANYFMSLNSIRDGMYFRMHIPFVSSSWELDPCEKKSGTASADHPFGYFSGNNPSSSTSLGNANSELLSCAKDFFSNCKVPSLSNNLNFGPLGGTAPGVGTACDSLIESLDTIVYSDCINFEPLNHAKWACGKLKKNGVADWRFTLGYNAYSNEKFHVGFGLTGAAPTGNRPHGEYLFEPILGNGNHWEIGGQFTSHYQFWESEDGEKSFTGYLDANLTHLFKARQTRSFDLKDKPNSRYMLAQKLGEPCFLYNATLQKCIVSTTVCASAQERGTVTSGLTEAFAQFKNAYTPVANLTTVDVNVNIGAQVDLALMFNYTTRNWSFDLGYNLWARTCERIKLDCKCPTRLEDGQTWALKGRAQVYGANGGCTNVNLCTEDCDGTGDVTYSSGIGTLQPYALGATESKATIHDGAVTANVTPTSLATDGLPYGNRNIDSPRFAVAAVNLELCPLTSVTTLAGDTRSGERKAFSPLNTNRASNVDPTLNSRIMNSKNPIYLSNNDLDLDGAATKGLSHKVFGNISYQWLNKEDYTPFLGIGASGEFASNNGDCCPTSGTSTTSSSSSVCCPTSSSICREKDCDSGCKRCSLSQWSVWVKGGLSFN